jgi:hypothetical protein
MAMMPWGAEITTNEQRTENNSMISPRAGLRAGTAETWSFVYGFFSNGTPFDAPNRSEPCPRAR